jgi:geranylgeranyl diphosphate synthase, type II
MVIMDAGNRIEHALQSAIGRAAVPGCPPLLAAAMNHAVFPRGARVRPRLCLAVAAACGDDEPALSDVAAASIELLHCASLVHDDLPCFDDAAVRRNRPSVHRAFGEPLAVLTGDALIVLAFQTLGRVTHQSQRLALLLMTVSRSVGVPFGIVAGQAWECEQHVDVAHYHRSKTGALFAAAAMTGAAAAGSEHESWRMLGEKLGEAYQAADDIRDAAAESEEIGKPVGRDLALGRPNVVAELGLVGAIRHLENLIGEAIAAIPACPGAAELEALVLLEAKRLMPKKLAQHVA